MSGKVQFKVQMDKEYRPLAGDFIVRLALRMEVSERAETLPVNLCLLIDRSTSMDGEKMDKAKESARELISSLRDGDYFCLIAFSTEAEILVPRTKINDRVREAASAAVDRIEAGGLTRMDLALAEAYSVLANGAGNFMNVLLFLSDGAPTDDDGYLLADDDLTKLTTTIETSRSELGLTTSAIGLGEASECLADFLEVCGEKGGGLFYHADDPSQLADRFKEEFNRVATTAITGLSFQIKDVNGTVRKAGAIFPDVRDLGKPILSDNGFTLSGGTLQKGEEHAFLVEIVTPASDTAGRKKLCDVEVLYELEGETHHIVAPAPLIEYTNEEILLGKPGHPEVEKFKGMYNTFIQTQKAVANIREGGDLKKTRVLLASAAKTTRRLGLTKQTKLLQDMADKIETGEEVSENDITKVAVASRKTKVLDR